MQTHILLLSMALVSVEVIASPLMLVTESDYIESSKNPIAFYPKYIPPKDAPVIELLVPNLQSPIYSPTAIEVKFVPKSPASIKPETFKAYYGTFQIDITERLLGVAKVAAQGITVKEAALPKGDHKITLNVEDSEGRVGSKVVTFEVK
jgi:hypothetical protein